MRTILQSNWSASLKKCQDHEIQEENKTLRNYSNLGGSRDMTTKLMNLETIKERVHK